MDDLAAETRPLDDAVKGLLGSVIPPLQARIMEGCRVLALRHVSHGTPAVELALAARHLAPSPEPGTCQGTDPWVIRNGPTETLLLTSNDRVADGLLQALRPGLENLACALDQSAGCLVFELLGEGVTEVLQRLLDASAIPRHAGQAARARCMDIGALVVRLEPARVLLVVDRMHGNHVAQWILHASHGDANPA